jgi:hypothetical protein
MTGTSIIPTIVAVVIITKIKKFINRFKETGTISPQTAKTLDQLNLERRFIYRKLFKHEVIIESSANRFYLHEGNLIEYNNKRRMVMFIIISILAIIILVDSLYIHF